MLEHAIVWLLWPSAYRDNMTACVRSKRIFSHNVSFRANSRCMRIMTHHMYTMHDNGPITKCGRWNEKMNTYMRGLKSWEPDKILQKTKVLQRYGKANGGSRTEHRGGKWRKVGRCGSESKGGWRSGNGKSGMEIDDNNKWREMKHSLVAMYNHYCSEL